MDKIFIYLFILKKKTKKKFYIIIYDINVISFYHLNSNILKIIISSGNLIGN